MSELATAQKSQFDGFTGRLDTFANASGERLDAARAESADGARGLREEVVTTLRGISDTIATAMKSAGDAQKDQLETFANRLDAFTKLSGDRLEAIRAESASGAKNLREEVIAQLTRISDASTNTLGELTKVQEAKLGQMSIAISALSESTEKRLEAMRVTVEGRLQSMQAENTKQLEEMRKTVDEKLQGTLEKRLGESFSQVSKRLEEVQRGLGEMQTLAIGVGDIKKIFANVKTRGTWGEVQLGALLEQMLSPEQYASNVATKDGNERVEFAVKMPGQGGDGDEPLWLPIDAKFPLEDYQRLVEAQENADIEGMAAAGKQLENRVKACARDIEQKYIGPPKTTNFAIMYLPTEGLFAEVVRRTGLVDQIQRESRVGVAGPTTLGALLSSLQMGFSTLTIQKHSSEVWKLLAAVKTEWRTYGGILNSLQKKLQQASNTIDVAEKRSKAIGKKLRDVHELPVAEASVVLQLNMVPDDVETIDDLLDGK